MPIQGSGYILTNRGLNLKIIVWVVRIAFFLVVLTFSIRNTDSVTVKWLLGLETQVPLVMALLCALLLGAGLAWVSLLPSWIRARRNASIAMRGAEKLQAELSRRDPLGKPTGGAAVESSSPPLSVSSADGI
jgi:uncharacterized integral membrane protein